MPTVSEVEASLLKLWNDCAINPQWMGMSMGNLRSQREHITRVDVLAFIDGNPDAPDSADVILSDRAGNPVHFASEEEIPSWAKRA